MKSFYSFVFILFTISIINGQSSHNMWLTGAWDPGGLTYNDVWGFTNGGNEYAVIGSRSKIHFIDVSGSGSPTLHTEFTPGSSSIWRDFKSFGNYIYAVADQGSEGLLIYDVSGLPSTITLASQNTSFFLTAHNIFIDHSTARLYVAGSNSQYQGVIVLDISTPTAPTLLASINLSSAGGPGGSASYIHDIHVRNSIAYCNHVYDASLHIYDFTNATSPSHLGSIKNYLESGYNHACWLNGAGTHLVFVDETHGASMKIMDVTTPSNLSINSNNLFKSDLLGLGTSIAHNPFIIGNYCYTSYYHDGIQIFDISNPNNVVRVAYYDTYPDNTNYAGYEGCWGMFPFLPSGKLLSSDITYGLIVAQTGPFPVELSSFDATLLSDEKIRLEWTTITELNNQYFEIQRSMDGISFETIHTISGNGTSSTPNSYSFIDRTPEKGRNYYRLKQFDHNEEAEFSNVVFADVKVDQIKMTFVNNRVSIQSFSEYGSTQGHLQIFNAAGKLMFNRNGINLKENPQYDISIPEIDSGVYFLQLSTQYRTLFEKIFVP